MFPFLQEYAMTSNRARENAYHAACKAIRDGTDPRAAASAAIDTARNDAKRLNEDVEWVTSEEWKNRIIGQSCEYAARDCSPSTT